MPSSQISRVSHFLRTLGKGKALRISDSLLTFGQLSIVSRVLKQLTTLSFNGFPPALGESADQLPAIPTEMQTEGILSISPHNIQRNLSRRYHSSSSANIPISK
jgi:hypothetical protein